MTISREATRIAAREISIALGNAQNFAKNMAEGKMDGESDEQLTMHLEMLDDQIAYAKALKHLYGADEPVERL